MELKQYTYAVLVDIVTDQIRPYYVLMDSYNPIGATLYTYQELSKCLDTFISPYTDHTEIYTGTTTAKSYKGYKLFHSIDDLIEYINQRLNPEEILSSPIQTGILSIKKLTKEEPVMEQKPTVLYDFFDWKDYDKNIAALAAKAMPEKWGFSNTSEYCILKSYIEHTFLKLQEEGKVIETDTYCIFNTGLYTEFYEPIYVYAVPHKYKGSNNKPKWFFNGFKTDYEFAAMDEEIVLPERADYFSDPSKFIFNWHYPINVNYNHILSDVNHMNRLPDRIKNDIRPLELLRGAIDTSITKLTTNYKLAVPSYYNSSIQLMVPLYLGDDDSPSAALVLKQKGKCYQAVTCLTMEMAYMDARLIARPESNWLMAENIQGTEQSDELSNHCKFRLNGVSFSLQPV